MARVAGALRALLLATLAARGLAGSGAASAATTVDMDLRRAISGAAAGAISNGLLHPLDTVKTVRQSNPKAFPGTFRTIHRILSTDGPGALYGGIGTAMLGAMPSSFVFFGTYEAVKSRLSRAAGNCTARTRAQIHVASAACGNCASSLIYVPKEMIKQRLQAAKVARVQLSVQSIVTSIVREHGVRGLYSAYTATIFRNIPTTVLNFLIYEELKHQLAARLAVTDEDSFLKSWSMVCGAISGASASVLVTPVDVCKTRLATGQYLARLGLRGSLLKLAREEGVGGLFAGAKARMLGSALFSAIGLSSYEACKHLLRCDQPVAAGAAASADCGAGGADGNCGTVARRPPWRPRRWTD